MRTDGWKIGAIALFPLLFALGAPEALPAGESGLKIFDRYSHAKYEEKIDQSWRSIFFDSRKIGFSTQSIEKGPLGYRVSSRALLKLTIGGVDIDISSSARYFLDHDRARRAFSSYTILGERRRETIGEIDGEQIRLLVRGRSRSEILTIEAPPGIEFIETFLFSSASLLKRGARIKIPVFIPEARAVRPMKIAVGRDLLNFPLDGVEYKVFELDSDIDGATTRSLVTEDGKLIRETQSRLALESRHADEKSATQLGSASISIASLITFSLIKPDREIVDPGALAALELAVTGAPSPTAIPEDYRQRRLKTFWSGPKSARSVTVGLKIDALDPTKTIPIKDLADALDPTTREKYLAASPEIESDSEKIKTLARKIVGTETDAYRAALKINDWVYKNMKKSLTDSFSALDALEAMEGECQAHTYLTVALARASKIPAREVSGIVYSPSAGGFLYHAWPEVYVGSWSAIDPTLGESVANPTHVKLVEGGHENQSRLLSFVGALSISIKRQTRR